MMEFIQSIGDKIFTEAGLVAFLLFWAYVYQMYKNTRLETYNRQLNGKVYQLGTSQITAMGEFSSVLDKVLFVLQRGDTNV